MIFAILGFEHDPVSGEIATVRQRQSYELAFERMIEGHVAVWREQYLTFQRRLLSTGNSSVSIVGSEVL